VITSRPASAALVVLALAASAALTAACSERAPAPVAPVEQAAPTKPGVPPISKAKMDQVRASFDAAAKLAAQADVLRREGEKIEAAQGREAANDTLAKAKKLYRQAAMDTEEWIEEELGPFTEAQIDAHLRAFVNERAGWIKKAGQMGKLHD